MRTDPSHGDVRRAPPYQIATLATGYLGVAVGLTLMFAVTGDRTEAPWYAASAVMVASATVVVLRRPSHPLCGWFCLFVAAQPWQYVGFDALAWAIDDDVSDWIPAAITLAGQAATAISIVAAMQIFARFPDGAPPDRAARTTLHVVHAVLALGWASLLTARTIAWPSFIDGDPPENPLRIPGVAVDVDVVRGILGLSSAAGLVGLVLVIRRYRRAPASIRRQIRWLLLPLVVAVFGFLADLLLESGHVAPLVGVVASSTLAVAIAFGLIRPAGVDADDVIRRSVTWALVWLTIAATYIGLSAAFGATIGRRSSIGWAVTTTVLAMLALQPVRTTLERIANRRLFGSPPDPRRAVARLGESLAGTYDLGALLPQIAAALEEGLGVEWARVRLSRTPPDHLAPALSVPIALDGEELGVLECGQKRNGQLDEDDEAIVATFARQAALAVRNVRLTTQLLERTSELADSRAQLIRAEEAERRRIERDIHDGVQQELVALIGQTGLIRRRLDRGAAGDASDLGLELGDLQAGLRHLLTELRELAAGIHPSVLRDRGLLAAVEALAGRHPAPVTVRAEPELIDLRLPMEIEGAGYYIVAESLANSLKHADAGLVEVSLSRSNGAVSIRITDDGQGFDDADDAGRGQGLANLRARVTALDGVLTVNGDAGSGTTVAALLPLDGAAR